MTWLNEVFTLKHVADTVGFFCLTTDLYGNAPDRINQWVAARSIKRINFVNYRTIWVVLAWPLGMLALWILAALVLGSIKGIFASVVELYHFVATGFSFQYYASVAHVDPSPVVIGPIDVFIIRIVPPFIRFVIVPVVIGYIGFYSAVFFAIGLAFVFEGPIRLLMSLIDRFAFKRVLLFSGVLLFLVSEFAL